MLRDIPSRFARARLVPGLKLLPSGFLYNPRDAESFSVNPTGAFVIEALQRGASPDRLYAEVAAAFEVSEGDAWRDVYRFLVALQQAELLKLPEQAAAAPGKERPEHG